MSSSRRLADLLERDSDLQARLRDAQAAGELTGSSRTLKEMNRVLDVLLADMAELDVDELTLDEYERLTGSLMRWQAASSAALQQPREISMPAPPAGGYGRIDTVLDPNQIQSWLDDRALYQSKVRTAAWLLTQVERLAAEGSSDEERADDWHQAQVYLALKVLDGTHPLPGRWTSDAYHHLESVWLDEVRRLLAYLLWKEEGEPLWGDGLSHYYGACDRIRTGLKELSKGSDADFEEVRTYLRKEYLVSAGPRDRSAVDDRPGSSGNELIARKAQRLWEVGQGDGERLDWARATSYVKTFYESIIPAVLDGDPECRRRVLNAVGLDDTDRDHWRHTIVNAFEAAVTLYFLAPDSDEAAAEAG